VLLLGLGYTQFSMNPLSIPAIRRVLHEVSIQDSRAVAEKVLNLETTHDVCRFLTDSVSKLVKTDLAYYAREIVAPNGKPSNGKQVAF
jgi:signal transduction protein with GAF and PtsI domain